MVRIFHSLKMSVRFALFAYQFAWHCEMVAYFLCRGISFSGYLIFPSDILQLDRLCLIRKTVLINVFQSQTEVFRIRDWFSFICTLWIFNLLQAAYLNLVATILRLLAILYEINPIATENERCAKWRALHVRHRVNSIIVRLYEVFNLFYRLFFQRVSGW